MREDITTEFKRQYTVNIKREIVAFLNSEGGIVYIGIDDAGETVGVDTPSKVVESVSQICHESILPDPTRFVRCETIERDSKEIVRVTVVAGVKKPYYLREKGLRPGGVYVRVNNTCQQADEHAIREMLRESDSSVFERLVSLEQDLSFTYVIRRFEDLGIEWKPRTLGIIDSNGHYSNLALLLSDQCPYSIKAAVFSDEGKSEFVDRREFSGSLVRQVDDAAAYLSLKNERQSEYDGFVRIDRQGYSDVVLREGILNSVVHRNYALRGNTIINIYPRSIEFVSIGGLVEGLSIEEVMSGVSRTRNERLAAVFYKLKYIESYGTGIRKMLWDYRFTEREPVFKSMENSFILILPSKIGMVRSLESELLEFVESHGKVTRAEIQKRFNLKLTRTVGLVRKLVDEGLIASTGSGKNISYYCVRT